MEVLIIDGWFLVLAQASPGENNSLLFSPNLKWSCIFLHQIDAFNLPSHKIVFRLIIIQPATIATQIRQRSHQLLYRSSIQDDDLRQLIWDTFMFKWCSAFRFHCRYIHKLACSRRSNSGERCEVKTPLLFNAFFTPHRSPLSERLEQAIHKLIFWACYRSISTLFCNNMTSYRDYRELPSPSFRIKTLPRVIIIIVKIGRHSSISSISGLTSGGPSSMNLLIFVT